MAWRGVAWGGVGWGGWVYGGAGAQARTVSSMESSKWCVAASITCSEASSKGSAPERERASSRSNDFLRSACTHGHGHGCGGVWDEARSRLTACATTHVLRGTGLAVGAGARGVAACMQSAGCYVGCNVGCWLQAVGCLARHLLLRWPDARLGRRAEEPWRRGGLEGRPRVSARVGVRVWNRVFGFGFGFGLGLEL